MHSPPPPFLIKLVGSSKSRAAPGGESELGGKGDHSPGSALPDQDAIPQHLSTAGRAGCWQQRPLTIPGKVRWWTRSRVQPGSAARNSWRWSQRQAWRQGHNVGLKGLTRREVYQQDLKRAHLQHSSSKDWGPRPEHPACGNHGWEW